MFNVGDIVTSRIYPESFTVVGGSDKTFVEDVNGKLRAFYTDDLSLRETVVLDLAKLPDYLRKAVGEYL